MHTTQDNEHPAITLHFFRHNEKEKGQSLTEAVNDTEIRLTKKGREQSVEAGKQKNIDYQKAVGYCSPRKRTKETLYHCLQIPGITSEKTLEEIEADISKNLPFGKKATEDTRLDFYL
ncbi:MAG: histidine phosphatase family protein [Candidatus Peribacteria bacterium]|jgi:broad specificity phosphatase PhoE|nr:histidine phosphatase family protein [Candidatus Peribacteria bacterium]